VTHSDSISKQHLRDFLLLHKDEITGYLNQLKSLQKIVTHTHKTMVICHTDLHGENLMVDDQGNLYIMDWENAMIAPPEHDLFFFAGYDSFWDTFLPHYTREFGPVNLNRDMFAFYYYRRGLEDLADWIIRILRGDGGDAQDQADLGEISDCLTGLAYVEKTVAEINKNWRDNK
jgi:aminoglycoside phosphotransferase (APT) family kinase protein